MFAHDRGWLRRMKEAIKRGMTAEAAVERVQNDTRSRMLRQADAYWRDRLKDLDGLSDRLLRILSGRPQGARGLRQAAARHHPGRTQHGPGRPARLRPLAPARAGARGVGRPEPRRHRRQGARHRRRRRRARHPGARRAGQSDHRRRRDRRGAHPPVERRDRRLRRQGPLPRPAAPQVPRAARQAGCHQGRPAHRAAHQRRPDDGRAASGRVRCRRHRPVPHRAAVHGVGDHAAPRPADADVPFDRRRRPGRSRWCSARSTSAATRCCPTCASRRRRTRRWAGAPSAWRSTGPGCCARRCARCCAPPPARAAPAAADGDRRRRGRHGARRDRPGARAAAPARHGRCRRGCCWAS